MRIRLLAGLLSAERRAEKGADFVDTADEKREIVFAGDAPFLRS